MKILIATGNPHKLKELLGVLPTKTRRGTPLQYVSLADFSGLHLPPENGQTLEENAALKAVYAARKTGLAAISDDTGLEVDALNGAPGVYTARYAGAQADDDDNNRKLLSALEHKQLPQRTARFRTIACLATPEGQTCTFEGTLEGFIGFGYRGTNGFGYDPIFMVDDGKKALAELTETQKNKISHRGKAFRKLAAQLTAEVPVK
ncbi:MAG: RdgB/HAM1 family non-canonical purine NTP pyrophosphatase [Elusimicrobiaceae bacterium]|nr:RdgB/HAM1 family non-canonical purine NTP pyrophosphatase [Elusimicrobiaceae bacterium]